MGCCRALDTSRRCWHRSSRQHYGRDLFFGEPSRSSTSQPAAEAKTLIKEARASGSKKPIDDIFKAIDRTSAAIETGATRLILKELDQTMTKAEWVAYAQKASSPSGAKAGPR